MGTAFISKELQEWMLPSNKEMVHTLDTAHGVSSINKILT